MSHERYEEVVGDKKNENTANLERKSALDLFSTFLNQRTPKITLLTGSVTGKARKEALAGMESGEIDVIVGTHALIQEKVSFGNLGFVTVDEQHRFGVNQRSTLKEKGLEGPVEPVGPISPVGPVTKLAAPVGPVGHFLQQLCLPIYYK